jgi:hypothetical protein
VSLEEKADGLFLQRGIAACCSALAALARLQAEKCFFTGEAGKKTYLILFRLLRKPKLCEAFLLINRPR